MRVEEIMSRRVVTVELDDTLETVKELFDNVRFHHLLVVENGKLFGVLSDRDLLKALSPNIDTICETSQDRATLGKRVHQAMNRKPLTLREDDHIGKAVFLFNTETITCIPIVDSEMKPVGIVSWRDLMKLFGKLLKGKAVEG